MKIVNKRCEICHKLYLPDLKAYRTQKCCSNPVCRKERKSRAKKRWWKNNPDYDNYRRDKIKAWAKTYPDYWRKYRREHPDYVKKDNKRRSVRSKKSGISAKQDEIRKISVEKLNRIQEITPDFSAKQDKINRRVNDILEYLLWKESSAKQNHID